MVYIVVLNWKGAADTLACLESLANLKGVRYRIVVCDNNSPDNSYDSIRSGILDSKSFEKYELIELDREQAESDSAYVSLNEDFITMIQTGDNLGYSGGNNVGIKYSLNQPDMTFVWILNNDTEVDCDSLGYMLREFNNGEGIGLCGSKLVYYYNRDKIQGFGGIYNKWLGTTKHYLGLSPSNWSYDSSEIEQKIDYIIGASMLIPKETLISVGLLDDKYFLYYEELDYCLRVKSHGLRVVVADKSCVYHKEGASMNYDRGIVSDFYSVRNRLIITGKYFKGYFIFVFASLLFVCVNRLRRGHFLKAKNVLMIMFGKFKL